MKRILIPVIALLATLVLTAALGCGPDDGEECSKCSSSSDCQGGLRCNTFSDGSRRCGSICSGFDLLGAE